MANLASHLRTAAGELFTVLEGLENLDSSDEDEQNLRSAQEAITEARKKTLEAIGILEREPCRQCGAAGEAPYCPACLKEEHAEVIDDTLRRHDADVEHRGEEGY